MAAIAPLLPVLLLPLLLPLTVPAALYLRLPVD
jgi:hypothetical protein